MVSLLWHGMHFKAWETWREYLGFCIWVSISISLFDSQTIYPVAAICMSCCACWRAFHVPWSESYREYLMLSGYLILSDFPLSGHKCIRRIPSIHTYPYTHIYMHVVAYRIRIHIYIWCTCTDRQMRNSSSTLSRTLSHSPEHTRTHTLELWYRWVWAWIDSLSLLRSASFVFTETCWRRFQKEYSPGFLRSGSLLCCREWECECHTHTHTHTANIFDIFFFLLSSVIFQSTFCSCGPLLTCVYAICLRSPNVRCMCTAPR